MAPCSTSGQNSKDSRAYPRRKETLMQREFSKELVEDREFEIGGEVFRFRYPLAHETSKLWDENLEPVVPGSGQVGSALL